MSCYPNYPKNLTSRSFLTSPVVFASNGTGKNAISCDDRALGTIDPARTLALSPTKAPASPIDWDSPTTAPAPTNAPAPKTAFYMA